MRQRQLGGERHDGFWRNIGTPQQLARADVALRTPG